MNTHSINKTLFNLSTIKSYKKGDVIDTSSDYMNVLSYNYIESLRRSIAGDSRQKAINRFRSEIESAKEYAERLLESRYFSIYQRGGVGNNYNISVADYKKYAERRSLCARIYTALRDVSNGLINFNEDKGDDLPTRGDCERLIADVYLYHSELKKQLIDLDAVKDEFDAARAGFVAMSCAPSTRSLDELANDLYAPEGDIDNGDIDNNNDVDDNGDDGDDGDNSDEESTTDYSQFTGEF